MAHDLNDSEIDALIEEVRRSTVRANAALDRALASNGPTEKSGAEDMQTRSSDSSDADADVPGHGLERIQAALKGRFDADQLSPDEKQIYDDMFSEALSTPDEAELAFFADMRKKGGAVGYDDEGRLVRTLPGGGIEVIEEADGSEW